VDLDASTSTRTDTFQAVIIDAVTADVLTVRV
jgi:hypothetical protein